MENSNIIGIYEYTINIPTMFHIYQMKIKNHNLITYVGEKYFIERWVSNNYPVINKIAVGTNTTKPSKNDTEIQNATIIDVTSYENTGTKLTITAEAEGSSVNGITEIGVMAGTDRLISHDVHDTLTIPSTCQVAIEYSFIITNSSYEYNWTSEGSSIYSLSIESDVHSITEEDTDIGYSRVQTSSDMEAGEYYVAIANDEYTLYIRTSDSLNPNTHTILVNYKEQ